MWLVLCVLLAFASGKELTDEEYFRLPRLFHLDDYEACLARRGGLYCLGTFRLAPKAKNDVVYSMMEEYSKTPHHFNRTRVHRGYCVSARCPLTERSERSGLSEGSEQNGRNESWRFERCVESWAQTQGFRSDVHAIEYCRTTEETGKRKTTVLDTPMIVFIAVAFCIVFVNLVCTFYDWMRPDTDKKNKVLLTWSMKSNWQRLTAHHVDGDPRLISLQPLQGVRVFIMILVIALHSGLFYHMLYTHNPRSLENVMKMPIMILIRNGTSLVEVFVILSSFLLAYNLLLHSKTHPLGLRMLPKIWLTRIIRLSPVYLVAVGFAATWWPVLSDGPMWYMVESSAAACRRKFWTHAVYLNNVVDPDDQCLVQTWFLAVDMQLFIISSVATLLLARWRRWALVTLAVLLAAASLANGMLAYYYDWTTMLYVMSAEYHRTLYRGVPSFKWYYASSWGSLPASLTGLFLAFLHFDLQERGFKAAEHKWLVWLYHCSIPLVLGFVSLGAFVEDNTSRIFAAAYVALERPLYSMLCTVCLFGMVNNVNNIVRKFYAWRGFHALGRMTLSALLLHWLLELTLHSASPLPLTYSGYRFVYGYVGTVVLTYAMSVPLTIMVEMPFQRTFAAIFT